MTNFSKDPEEQKKQLKRAVYALTKGLAFLVTSSAGYVVFAWGCMNKDWRAVFLSIVFYFLAVRFSKKDTLDNWGKRLRYVEKRLNISDVEAILQDDS